MPVLRSGEGGSEVNPRWPLFLFWLAQGSAWIAAGRFIVGALMLVVAAVLGMRLEWALKEDRELRR